VIVPLLTNINFLVPSGVVRALFFRFWYVVVWLIMKIVVKPVSGIRLDLLRAKETTGHENLSPGIAQFAQCTVGFLLALSLISVCDTNKGQNSRTRHRIWLRLTLYTSN